MASTAASPALELAAPYVPRMLLGWGDDEPRHRRVEGSLVSADISGFTALSERLATHGREGAEELTVLLNRCFSPMIEIVEAHGGDVLKFGGDALLVLFSGADHTRRAAGACWRMRALVERNWSTSLVRKIELGISQGIHTGLFDLHLVDGGHQELLVIGRDMTRTVECEGSAQRGEILLSHAAAAALEGSALGPKTDHGRPLIEDVGEYLWLIDEPDASGSSGPFVPDWLQEQAAVGRVAEHRVVSIGFLEFGSVDEVLEARGPDVTHRELERLARVTRDMARRHGVHWLASDVYPGGGKLILTAGAPASTGQDEDALARTVRGIMDAEIPFPLRAGVNAGPVFMGDLGSERRRTFTVMGDAVNLAARLMQKAGVGQMVVSRGVVEAVHSPLTTEDLEPFFVKGKSRPIEASAVARIESTPVDIGFDERPVGFVGRERELTLLGDLLEAARQGSGAVVDLVGEPGIGKSRLVAEALDRSPGLTVLRSRGGLYSRSTPYRAARTLLRDLAGCDQRLGAEDAGAHLSRWVEELEPSLVKWLPLLAVAFDARVAATREVEQINPSNRAAKLRDVTIDLLKVACPGGSVFVIDDAQWLDEASDELFGALSHRVATSPWVIIGLRRADTDSFASRHSQARGIVLGELAPGDTRRLALAAIEAGLGSDVDQLDELIARGVTNPLFLLELVRSGPGAETPDSIEALVTARIDTLDAANRVLLREAAVLGAQIDPELLGEATGDPDLRRHERWAPLAGFLQPEHDGTYGFQHGLYRQVAYDGLSFRRRKDLHRSIGEALERRAGEDPESMSELLSVHFHRSKDWARSWRYSTMAGDRARAKYANVEAADFYEQSLESARRHRVPRAEVSKVAEALGDVAELAARYDQADRAITVARRYSDDPVAGTRLLRKEGTLRVRSGRFTQGLRFYGRGLTAAERLTDGQERHEAIGQLCLAYSGARFRQGKSRECVRWAHRAEDEARCIGDRAMLAHAYYLLGIGSNVQRSADAPGFLHESLALFEQEGDLLGQANVLNNLGVDAKDDGRWHEAIELYERSRDARDVIGDVVGAATASNNIAEILSDQGRLDEAEPLYADALRIWRRADFAIGIAIATSYLGRLQARRGNFDEARALLADALERFREIGAAHYVLETQVFGLECELLAEAGDHVGEADALLAGAERMEDVLLRNVLLRLKAWALAQRGAPDAALAEAEKAIAAGEEARTPFELAMSLLLRGALRNRTGGDGHADHTRAADILGQLGVVWLPELHRL